MDKEFDERLLQLMPLHRGIKPEEMIGLFGTPSLDQRNNDGDRQVVWCDLVHYWLLAGWDSDSGAFLGAWCRPIKTSEDEYEPVEEYLVSRGYTLPQPGDDLVHDTKACLREACKSLDIVYEIDEDGDLDLVELKAERSDATMLEACMGTVLFGESIPDVSHIEVVFVANVGADASSRPELRSLIDAYNHGYRTDHACLDPERPLLIMKDFVLVDERLGLTPKVAQLVLFNIRASLVRLTDAARAVTMEGMSAAEAFERYLRQ